MIRRTAIGLALLCLLVLLLSAAFAARYLVFWSPSEEIVFESGDVLLAGTLFKPRSDGRFPAAIVLHGAGPDERGGVGYRLNAKALLRRGFAVLLYDKRGAGASGGDFRTAGYPDFIADAKAAVRFLVAREDIDGRAIGLFGNSESGWFTPEIAVDNPAVAFIVNRVGSPLSLIETITWEARNDYRADGVAEADLDALLGLTRRIWDYLRTAARDPAYARGPARAALQREIDGARASIADAEQLFDATLPPYDPEAYAGYLDLSYDPRPYLQRLEVPLLYVFAEDDINVPTAQSVAFLESLRDESGKDITIQVHPDIGHSMQSWRYLLSGAYPPGYLDFVSDWAARQIELP